MNQKNPEEELLQIQQTQQELEEKARKIWKIFGRNTHAGRILHQVYQLPQAVKIDYPKPKAKPKTEQTLSKIPKPCPQKTKIEYPPAKIIEEKKIAKVDLIPKRKNYEEIRKEIDEFYRVPVIPVNKGVDRGLLIEKTQKKFKELRGGLPKKAELPQINPDPNGENNEENNENIKCQALKKINKKKYLNFMAKEKHWDDEKNPEKEKKGEEKSELIVLYDQIVEEMEERQNFLESIVELEEPVLKTKIKKEIIDRVSELQKITEMLKDLKKK